MKWTHNERNTNSNYSDFFNTNKSELTNKSQYVLMRFGQKENFHILLLAMWTQAATLKTIMVISQKPKTWYCTNFEY